MRRLAVPVLLLSLAACGGGGSSPTGTSTPPPAPAPSPSPTPSPTSGATVLRMAAIAGANGHAAGGTARIVRDGTSFTLELLDDFRIDSGNNDVYLTNQTSGFTSADLNLGAMRSRTGAQSYALPNDGAGYRYVLLWCRPFLVPIGLGELR